MLQNWDFLIAEIWVLLVLALLVGLVAGWLIFGGRKVTVAPSEALRAELAQARSSVAEAEKRNQSLRSEMDALRAARKAPVPPPVPPKTEEIGVKPATLAKPRGGAPDDLKRIRGVGPKLEKLCNELGFFHYDQIAAWTEDEVAWVDDAIVGFKGRVSRDDWVSQSKVLAEGGETEFSRRQKGRRY